MNTAGRISLCAAGLAALLISACHRESGQRARANQPRQALMAPWTDASRDHEPPPSAEPTPPKNAS